MVTGASGFVGRNLVATLAAAGRSYFTIGREAGQADGKTDWNGPLSGVSTVVHLAGRHSGDAQVFERDVEMTLNFARQAAERGVERFVYVSSIKVHGDRTAPGHAFNEADKPEPQDHYGHAKLKMEQALRAMPLPLTVIRPVLVYGPGVNGNFGRLMEAVERGWPLPFGAVENKRSLVAAGNLCDFIMRVLDEPAAVGETYVLSDGEDLSTAELLRRIARLLNRPSRLVPVSPGLIEGAMRVVGLGGLADRLICDLRVDSGKARALGWVPPLSFDDGLALLARSPR